MEMLFEYRSKSEVGILQRDGDWDTSWSLGMPLFLKRMEEVLKVGKQQEDEGRKESS